MNAYLVKIALPDVPPFDRADNWFESFIGNIIQSVVNSGTVGRFWFTRYGAIRHKDGKFALFRFETTDLEAVTKSLGNELPLQHAEWSGGGRLGSYIQSMGRWEECRGKDAA